MPTITGAIERYLTQLLNEENKSPHTARTYRTGLGHLCDYLRSVGRDPGIIGPDALQCHDVTDAGTWLQETRPVSHATLLNYLTSMNQFLSWLMVESYVEFSQIDWMRLQDRLKRKRRGAKGDRLPRVPDETDVQLVRTAATVATITPPPSAPSEKEAERLHLIALRNDAIVETLRSTGCRVSEVAGMNREDLNPTCTSALVTGKGRKQRFVYFDDAARNALQAYWQARETAEISRNGAEPVFARHDKRAVGKPMMHMSTNAFRDALDLLCQRAGAEHQTPHQYRHRFGTRVLVETGDLAMAQDLLGHSSPNTTRIYAHLTDEQLREAHESINLE